MAIIWCNPERQNPGARGEKQKNIAISYQDVVRYEAINAKIVSAQWCQSHNILLQTYVPQPSELLDSRNW